MQSKRLVATDPCQRTWCPREGLFWRGASISHGRTGAWPDGGGAGIISTFGSTTIHETRQRVRRLNNRRHQPDASTRPNSDGAAFARGYLQPMEIKPSFRSEYLGRDRVRRHTAAPVQQRIDQRTRRHIRRYAGRSREELSERIAQLEREWDVEQVLETNASLLALTGAILGTTLHKRFFAITGIVLGFLSQHALSGWCPPVPVFRRLGIRTRTEINQEKFALKALRGDFSAIDDLTHPRAAEQALQAVIT